jgi:hypothetical protein
MQSSECWQAIDWSASVPRRRSSPASVVSEPDAITLQSRHCESDDLQRALLRTMIVAVAPKARSIDDQPTEAGRLPLILWSVDRQLRARWGRPCWPDRKAGTEPVHTSEKVASVTVRFPRSDFGRTPTALKGQGRLGITARSQVRPEQKGF